MLQDAGAVRHNAGARGHNSPGGPGSGVAREGAVRWRRKDETTLTLQPQSLLYSRLLSLPRIKTPAAPERREPTHTHVFEPTCTPASTLAPAPPFSATVSRLCRFGTRATLPSSRASPRRLTRWSSSRMRAYRCPSCTPRLTDGTSAPSGIFLATPSLPPVLLLSYSPGLTRHHPH